MIAAANEDAEGMLWASRQLIRNYILAEYKSFLPAVCHKLSIFFTKLYITFDGWTTKNNHHVFTAVCIHHLDETG